MSTENLGTAEDLTPRRRGLALAGRSPRRPPEAGGAGAWSRPLQARPGDLESYARRGGMILEDHGAKRYDPRRSWRQTLGTLHRSSAFSICPEQFETWGVAGNAGDSRV